MPRLFFARLTAAAALFLASFLTVSAPDQIRDGGIDPWNLGKGDWIYFMSAATNKLGGNVPGVTNESSLMLFYKSQGIRYIIIKAATSDVLFNGSYSRPQFTSNLCSIARSNGILIFGYNRSYGSNVLGEIAISDYVFNQGADGFVWDAESEWESGNSWIGPNGPAKAWQLCSTVRSNWPNKFLAHAPFPIISYHTSFPYKEFGYWSDTIMPQIYHYGWTGVKRSPSGGINWSDVNWHNWHNSLYSLPPTNINGLTVYWTNAIKPLAPINHVYGPDAPPAASPIPDKDVLEFIDYLAADPHAVTPGGYKGVSFWRTDLHGAVQWSYIKTGTSGAFTGIVNNIVIDNPNTTTTGPWSSVRTFYNGSFYAGTSDTNSFGTNYLTKNQGTGSASVQFTPNILTAGDYDVYEWHPRRPDASASVPFLVTFNGGSNIVYANQQTNPGNWSLLGRFNFATGAAGHVRVLDNFPEPGAVAMADGLKFVLAAITTTTPAPTGLTAQAVSASQIDLQWKDNSANETNFVIARGTNSGGPYVDIVTLPPNTTSYSNTGLVPNKTYYYVVRARGPQGVSPNSNEANATTPNPEGPSILAQPQDQTVLLGQPATFTISVSGTPPLSYQWRLNGAPLAGATSSTLLLPPVQPSDTGAYAVTVTNLYGATNSAIAWLSVTTLGAWGDNNWGQSIVPPAATNVIAVAAGSWHSLALRLDGTVIGWGNNFQGQCDIPATITDALTITAGGYHSLAIKANGQVIAWGANDYGQASVPQQIGPAIAIAAGKWHSLALRPDGTPFAWGDNTWGQSAIPSGLAGATAIAAGGSHSLALKGGGTVVAWGQNTDAHGFFVGQSIVPLGLSNVVAIAAGDYHSVALRTDGTVVAWGDNSQGQSAVPTELSGVVAISAGGAHTLAPKSDGTVRAWGADWNGQGTIPPSVANAIGLGAGERHTLILVEGSRPKARLLHPSWRPGYFSAWAQTLNRTAYALEFKTSLASTNWTSLPEVTGNGVLRILADSAAPGSERFYRMRQGAVAPETRSN